MFYCPFTLKVRRMNDHDNVSGFVRGDKTNSCCQAHYVDKEKDKTRADFIITEELILSKDILAHWNMLHSLKRKPLFCFSKDFV